MRLRIREFEQYIEPVDPLLNRPDGDLADAIQSAWRWSADVPIHDVHARVRNGWVILSGRAETAAQRDAAEDAVTALVGVRGIVNRIAVTARGHEEAMRLAACVR